MRIAEMCWKHLFGISSSQHRTILLFLATIPRSSGPHFHFSTFPQCSTWHRAQSTTWLFPRTVCKQLPTLLMKWDICKTCPIVSSQISALELLPDALDALELLPDIWCSSLSDMGQGWTRCDLVFSAQLLSRKNITRPDKSDQGWKND